MAWSRISKGGRTDPHVIRELHLVGLKICRRDTQSVMSYAAVIGDFFLLRHNNARLQIAQLVEKTFWKRKQYSIWSGQHAIRI